MSAKITQKVVVTCDGPKCAEYDRSVCPNVVSWDQDDPQLNPDAYLSIPDEAYRIITRQDFYGNKRTFLSKQCERDFIRGWVAPLSPKEMSKMGLNEQQQQNLVRGGTGVEPVTEVQTREVKPTIETEAAPEITNND